MNAKIAVVMLGGVLVLASTLAAAQSAHEHKILIPSDVKWSPGPASLPAGAEAAVLFGDPAKEGLFAMRLKLPKDYAVAPHTHPGLEVVTVIAGTIRLGMGEMADRSKAQLLPAGSFLALTPGMAHFVFADEDTVIQINTNGPWGLNYVNADDDPRKKKTN